MSIFSRFFHKKSRAHPAGHVVPDARKTCENQKMEASETETGADESKMYIIAGLGNPGKKYDKTRHNCGFEALDVLASRYQIDVSSEKFRALCGRGRINGIPVLLMKPLTYMNLSGEAIRAAADYFKVDLETELIVLYDDVSLPPGQIRVRAKGSAGGHNGIKNIIQHAGGDRFLRVKIGAGQVPEGGEMINWVLGHFPPEETDVMQDAFERAAAAAAALLTEPLQQVMSTYNGSGSKREER